MKNGTRLDWFKSKYVVDTETECWDWIAAINDNGYGVFSEEKSRAILAHRYSFKIAYGFLPRCVCHKCDNRKCVNPAHLFGGTYQDNTDDAIKKGRNSPPPHGKGVAHPGAKVTPEIIAKIKSLYPLSQRKIAVLLGLSQPTVRRYQ